MNKNNNKSCLSKTLSVFLLLILVSLFFFNEYKFISNKFYSFGQGSYLANITAEAITKFTNLERKNNSTPSLTESDILNQVAQAKADDMARRNYFAHNTPDGKTPWYWLDLFNYKYQSAGENLAVNFDTSKEVVNAWMRSPSHRENLLKGKYVETGVGIAEGYFGDKKAVYVAQFFGLPQISTDQNQLLISRVHLGQEGSVLGAEIEKVPLTVWSSISTSFNHYALASLLFLLILMILMKKVADKKVSKGTYLFMILLLCMIIVINSIHLNLIKDLDVFISLN